MKKTKLVIIFTIIFLQINVESFSQTWKSKFELGGKAFWGNTDKFDINSSGRVSRKDSLMEFSLNYKIRYGEKDNEKTNETYNGGFKFDWLPQNKVSPFILLTAYKNVKKGIELRLSSLAGAKWIYYKTEKSNFSLSAAVTYDMDKYTDKKKDSEKDNAQITRLSIRPKFKQKFADGKVSFQWMFFYIPKKISIKFAYEMDYVKDPPIKIIKERIVQKKDDYFMTSILIKF
ncbi:MAG: hypothetical protein B6I24_08295 [Bacteroidetes bacterium 4572_128]|nr:MAG: hypothetical protein B6I24_08295 [Bacteroidetes bacterium 4572_128]